MLKIVEGPPSVGRLVGGAAVLSVAVSKLLLESADFWNPVPRERTVSKKSSLPPHPGGYGLGLLKAPQILAYLRIT